MNRLICSTRITFIKTKRDMSLIYGTSTIALKIFPFQPGLLLRSPSHRFHYGHSPDNVCDRVSRYGLSLTVSVYSKNYDVCLYSYWLQHELLSRYYYCIDFCKSSILSNIPPS